MNLTIMAVCNQLYSNAKRIRRNYAKLLLLSAVIIALPGCVYLRLLEVKSQLATFDQSFTVEVNSDGLVITFKKPTLRENDLETLGVRPTERTGASPKNAEWMVQMLKVYRKGTKETGNYPVRLNLEFENDLLHTVTVPIEYLQSFSAEFVVASLKALGSSKVQKLQRSIAANYEGNESEVTEITPRSVESVLGIPFLREENEGHITLSYRYRKDHPDTDEAAKRYTIVLTFDGESQRILSARSKSIKLEYAGGS